MYVGNNLKAMRKLRGLTQTELAEQVGVTNTTISNYEQAVSRPNIEMIEKLCQVLKCNKTDLIGENDMKRDISIALEAIDSLLSNNSEDELLYKNKPITSEVRRLIAEDINSMKRKIDIYCS